ncbi:MAG: beta-galactosidase [Clostridia bacterium]|nr:beta-galactosidase [Clostridia bacterium]
MYSIKNGIMYKNGRPVIGIGVAYYASFNPYKYPVPPEGNRIGEMKEDIPHIASMGFNMIRTCAFGKTERINGEVAGAYPFAEALVGEAEENGLAVLLRLQDYSMYMGDDPDSVKQRNERDVPVNQNRTFVPDCINHPDVIRDNNEATEYISKHFSKFKNVVLQLMYNEPSYSYDDFHDYHKETIKAYKKWLLDNGYETEKGIKNLNPPRRRPNPDEDDTDWILWRTFQMNKMSEFLCELGRYADKGNPNAESLTCMMPVMMESGQFKMGEDLFAMGDGMDIIGVTNYLPCYGQPIYYALQYADLLGSIAAMNGKNVWAVECNAHSTLSEEEWKRETYTLLGAGFKGLVYYQWRADYDNGKGPEIGMFGILRNDKTPTEKYGVIKETNAMIAKMSESLATSKRVASDVGIIFSHHANALFDAHENGWMTPERVWYAYDNFDPGSMIYQFDRYNIYLQNVYREVRQHHVIPNIVRTSDLRENRLGLKTVIVPTISGLSDEEVSDLEEFAKNGGYLFIYQPSKRSNGYTLNELSPQTMKIHRHARQEMPHSCTISDVIYMTGTAIDFDVRDEKNTTVFNVLENDDVYTVTITNFDSFERPVEDARLYINSSLVGNRAVFTTCNREIEISADIIGDRAVFKIPTVNTGCFVTVYKR